jgi:SAM-dependent methyltransferase
VRGFADEKGKGESAMTVAGRSTEGGERVELGSFYRSLAPWWPLISPVEDYRDEMAYVLDLFGGPGTSRRSLLELGSGGGHNAAFLGAAFDLTLVDLSEPMLEMSRVLNPTAEHLCADMRTVRLNRVFDRVLIHDAVDYMTSEADLRAALTTAFVHLRPGGTAVVMPDETREIFEAGEDTGGSDGDDGRAVRFLEWTVDPDPTDSVVRTDYVFVLRDADGQVEVVHDVHETGLFDRATWLRLLGEVGFQATLVTEVTDEDRTPRDVFVATK